MAVHDIVGSQRSQTYGALGLVAFVSYLILIKGSKKQAEATQVRKGVRSFLYYKLIFLGFKFFKRQTEFQIK